MAMALSTFVPWSVSAKTLGERGVTKSCVPRMSTQWKAGILSTFLNPPSMTAIIMPWPSIPMSCSRWPFSVVIWREAWPYTSPLTLSRFSNSLWYFVLMAVGLTESGDCHTILAPLTHGSARRRLTTVVS